ncbi:CGNR zinc finger domain-containing protein [Actinomadura logoneensis]|uniref:CGNR zinc finger domain-containing protein n=1 Tax=Actinomadura logoneensis TaxID=2293572 RepID=A0A372JE35_9ACTN|nr:CGNR zinc finger domain-containing protein [Actinomadura logoneensis]RFU38179.1 CGNR zinc finger domain-containing protein [Actinomadura logoneensis]
MINRPSDTADRAAALTGALRLDGADAAAVAALLHAHGEPTLPRITDDDVTALRAVADRLWDVFAAPDVGTAAGLLNGLLTEYAAPPRLSAHDGTAWHLHADRGDEASWAEWFAATSALALAVVLAERKSVPGGLCASPTCGRPFAMTGRGAPRRYCSARCGSRERVAAHRRAQK